MPSSLPQSDCTLAFVSHAHTQVRSPQAAPQYVYMDNIVWDNVVQYAQPAPMMQTIFMPYNPIERNSVAHHCLGQQKTPWQPQIEYQRKQDHYAPPVVLAQPQIRYVSQPVQAAVKPEIALQPVPATVYASAGSVAPVFDGYVPPMTFPMPRQVISTKTQCAMLLFPTLPLP
jgi:hypothetical protein